MAPKNQNKAWLYGKVAKPARDSFIRWAGHLPCSFGQLRGIVIGRMARVSALGLNQGFVMITVLECALELFYLSYPFALIKALVHSLSPVGGAQAARDSIRLWGSFLGYYR